MRSAACLRRRPLACAERAHRYAQGVATSGSRVWRVRSLPAKVREVGLAYTLFLSLQLLAPRLFRVDWFTVYERLPSWGVPPGARTEVRWATHGDVDLLSTLGHSTSVVEGRLARGDRACIKVKDGELLGYAWCSSGAYEDVGLRFELAADEVWLYDGMVARKHRGHGHYPALLSVLLADLAAEGKTRTLMAVDELNRNSRRVPGRHPLSRFLVVRIGGVSFVRAHRGADVRWACFRRTFGVPKELYELTVRE